ncbi:MAG: hypothetical protein ACI4PE_04255, partial [Bacilli bacterium]
MVDIVNKRLEISDLMSELSWGIIDEYEMDCIKKSVYDRVNYVYREASYLYLTQIEDYLKKARDYGCNLLDVKDDLATFAEKQIFLSMTKVIMEPLNDMNRKELINAYKEKYNDLKDKLSFFNNGYNILAIVNKEFFGMTKTEMNKFFKDNDVKSSIGYLEYMSDDLIKYYATLLEYVTDEVNLRTSDLKRRGSIEPGQHNFGNTFRIDDICKKMKALYSSIYNITPFEDIESNAFAQLSMPE